MSAWRAALVDRAAVRTLLLASVVMALGASVATAQQRERPAEQATGQPAEDRTKATGPATVPPDAAAGGARVPDRRPVVALVLGGGGARGAAHVGVLRALEQIGRAHV